MHIFRTLTAQARSLFVRPNPAQENAPEPPPPVQAPGPAALARPGWRSGQDFLQYSRQLSSEAEPVLIDMRGKKITSILSTPGEAPELKTLNVVGCTALTSLLSARGAAPKLETLYAMGCTGLTSVLSASGVAPNLRMLHVNGCTALTSILDTPDAAPQLEMLNAYYCSALTSILNAPAPRLKVLHLSYCTGLTSILSTPGVAPNLTMLEARFCSGISSIPDSFAENQSLRLIDFRNCSLTHFPRVFFDCHPDAEILLSHNPFSDEDIETIRAEIAQRRADNIPTPQITLPATADELNRLNNPEHIMENVVQDNGYAHGQALGEYVTSVLQALTDKFPATFEGPIAQQQQRMRSLQTELTQLLNEQAHEHPDFEDAMRVVSTMFEKGLGTTHEYANDFTVSPGHLLSYVFTAMKTKWAAACSPTDRKKLQQEHLNSLITALTYFKREQETEPCDTRNADELAQMIQIYDLAAVELSPSQMRDIALPIAQQHLTELLSQHPGGADEELQQQLQTRLLETMRDKAPGAPSKQVTDFFQSHILIAWDAFKDMAQTPGHSRS